MQPGIAGPVPVCCAHDRLIRVERPRSSSTSRYLLSVTAFECISFTIHLLRFAYLHMVCNTPSMSCYVEAISVPHMSDQKIPRVLWTCAFTSRSPFLSRYHMNLFRFNISNILLDRNHHSSIVFSLSHLAGHTHHQLSSTSPSAMARRQAHRISHSSSMVTNTLPSGRVRSKFLPRIRWSRESHYELHELWGGAHVLPTRHCCTSRTRGCIQEL